MENKANKVADVLVDFKSQRAYKESVLCSSSSPCGKRYASQGYAPEFRSRRKEFAMARRQKTLLCVDDNRSSLNTCKIILEDCGYKVLTASSGREGLEVLASNAIDAVILDYQMPEIDGELVAAEMKRTNPRIPILMLSGCVSLHKLKGSLKIGSLCFCSNCP